MAASLRSAASQKGSEAEIAEMKRTLAEFKRVVRQMNDAGITLLAGTDIAGTRVPGFTLHDELALLVQSGLTPLQALQTATVNAARFLGRADACGTVEIGKRADLILLDADPLADIGNTRRISAVIVAARLYRRPDLDALLAEGERLARAN